MTPASESGYKNVALNVTEHDVRYVGKGIGARFLREDTNYAAYSLATEANGICRVLDVRTPLTVRESAGI